MSKATNYKVMEQEANTKKAKEAKEAAAFREQQAEKYAEWKAKQEAGNAG